MTDLSKSNVTYVGGGQTVTPVGDSTLSTSLSTIAMGGTRVFAIYAAYQQIQSLKQNLTIAKNYYNENHKDFVFWNTTYNPKMLSALTEGMTRGFYTNGNFTPQYGALDYLASVGRGQSRASLKYDREWFAARRRVGRYNVGQGHRVDLKYSMARFNAELEGFNIGFRFEDNRKMMYDEQRHAHQAEILNLGIGAGNAVRAGLATAVQGLSEAKTQRAGMYGALSNGLATFAGFQDASAGARRDRTTEKQYALATAGKNPGISGGIPDVSQDQINKAAATA